MQLQFFCIAKIPFPLNISNFVDQNQNSPKIRQISHTSPQSKMAPQPQISDYSQNYDYPAVEESIESVSLANQMTELNNWFWGFLKKMEKNFEKKIRKKFFSKKNPSHPDNYDPIIVEDSIIVTQPINTTNATLQERLSGNSTVEEAENEMPEIISEPKPTMKILDSDQIALVWGLVS